MPGDGEHKAGAPPASPTNDPATQPGGQTRHESTTGTGTATRSAGGGDRRPATGDAGGLRSAVRRAESKPYPTPVSGQGARPAASEETRERQARVRAITAQSPEPEVTGAPAGEGPRFSQEDELEPDVVRRLDAHPSMRIPGVWQWLPGIVTARLQELVNWGRANSLWYLLCGLACCAIEMMAAGATRTDLDRIGSVFRASPRQADLMIVSGTVTEKMAPVVKTLYDQMAEPKFVISMGACATNGGPYYQGYNVVDGVDKIIPVDVYVAGCPPRPEALVHAILKLQDKVRKVHVPAGI